MRAVSRYRHNRNKCSKVHEDGEPTRAGGQKQSDVNYVIYAYIILIFLLYLFVKLALSDLSLEYPNVDSDSTAYDLVDGDGAGGGGDNSLGKEL